MYIPDRFMPSNLVRQIHYDEEGRLRTFREAGTRNEEGGIGEANSLYATDAEHYDRCAPHLRAAKIKDAKRRNYIIQPGGACIYFQQERMPPDPYENGRVQYTAPTSQESRGHNTMDAVIGGPRNGGR